MRGCRVIFLLLSPAASLLLAPAPRRATVLMGAAPLDRRRAGALAVASGAAAALGAAPRRAAAAAPRVAIETTAGTMEFELWDDVAPKTVANFVKLAREGFYDGQCFHRIIKGFVIQGGDPNSRKGWTSSGLLSDVDPGVVRRWGTGGPGYTVPAEFNPRKHAFGVLSMARSADPNSAGSQFFVCLGDLPALDNKCAAAAAGLSRRLSPSPLGFGGAPPPALSGTRRSGG